MTGRRLLALVLVWTLPPAIFVAATAHVYARAAIEDAPRLGEPARADAIRVLRAALVGSPAAPPKDPELARPLADGGPVIVTIWHDGVAIARVIGHGGTIADAVADAARALPADKGLAPFGPGDRALARIEVDVATARAPLGDGGPLFDLVQIPGVSAGLADAIAIDPGVDGIGASDGRGEVVLAPFEVTVGGLYGKAHPVPLLADLTSGLDRELVERALIRASGSSHDAWHAADHAWFRFRADAFVERPLADRAHAPVPLTRGLPPGPPVTAANLRAAAISGARYLVAHLAPSGRYIYEHDLVTGRRTDPDHGPYSIPRHAGVTYFLAQVYRATGEAWLREPIERAAAHLDALVIAGGCDVTLPDGSAAACVRDRNEPKASLGSSALAVVGLVEYEKATGDRRFRPLAEKLARWILWMQRPDGSFTHLYDVAAKQKDDDAMLFYFSGEAALALARMYDVTHDVAYAHAAERALDWLVAWYDFFLGGFFYGEEHWTCIAAEAIWPMVDKPAYQDFCDSYGAFLRGQQPRAGDLGDEDDLAGSYDEAAPLVLPPNTPAGSRTEAMISAYLLGVHRKQPDERIRDQILATTGYLLRQQIRPEGDFAARGGDVIGGMPASSIERTVRIDYVQHTGSAMLRAADLVDGEPRGAPPEKPAAVTP